jgi:hypothetical protein
LIHSEFNVAAELPIGTLRDGREKAAAAQETQPRAAAGVASWPDHELGVSAPTADHGWLGSSPASAGEEAHPTCVIFAAVLRVPWSRQGEVDRKPCLCMETGDDDLSRAAVLA